jgi:hypothetical protein
MTKTKHREPILHFATHEEEAAWWEKHDLSDYWHQFKPIDVRVAKNLSQGLMVRLDRDTMTQLRQRAQREGVGPTTLIRMWVKERLQHKQV